MNRIITILFTFFIIQLLVVNKTLGNEGEVNDCFEKLNRATFALNMGLDKVIFKPISKGYRKLPSPIRTGTSNALNTVSYTHLRAHETGRNLVCRLLLEKKK